MKMQGGFLRNVILGIVGGIVGGLVLKVVGLGANNIIGYIISGVLGSCIILGIVKAVKK
ncbi:MAG: GlsB/YeaQ/YmgE family stress response membrane protein [Eubacterium sp.]|nr:GlsB/YeaQ/YmgE family stress response membrane protein [Eubacterium sp.]